MKAETTKKLKTVSKTVKKDEKSKVIENTELLNNNDLKNDTSDKSDLSDKIVSPIIEQQPLVIKELTIHDKYRKQLTQINDDYVTGLDYGQIVEILRHTEKKFNQTIPINVNCASCVIELIRMFAMTEEK